MNLAIILSLINTCKISSFDLLLPTLPPVLLDGEIAEWPQRRFHTGSSRQTSCTRQDPAIRLNLLTFT